MRLTSTEKLLSNINWTTIEFDGVITKYALCFFWVMLRNDTEKPGWT